MRIVGRLSSSQAPVQLVAADPAEVVAAGVEEQRVQQRARVLQRRRVARAQRGRISSSACCRSCSSASPCRASSRCSWWSGVGVDVLEQRQDALVRAELRLGAAARLRRVDARAAAWSTGILRLRSTFTEMTSRFEVSNSSQAPRFGMSLAVAEVAAGGRVLLQREVHARRAHELRDDDALGAVDDEGAVGAS